MASKTTLTYVAATLAAIFMFTGVMFLMIVVGLCPLDVKLSRMEMVQRWGIGGLFALVAAVYSFRATVNRQKPRGREDRHAEAAKPQETSQSD